MPIHHIINLSFGFDLLPTIQISLLLGCEVQEIPGCTMRLSIIPEQVKRILDVWKSHAFRNSDGGQSATVIESPISYTRQAFGKNDGSQAAAVVESIFPYTHHTFEESDGDQAAAVVKGTVSYTRHAFGEGDGEQVTAITECPLSYTRHALFYQHFLISPA